MAYHKKRIAIIGAGCSGLTSIKACLEESLTPVCYEMSSDIGGLWNYNESTPTKDGLNSSVYKSCSINTSKEMMAFSDFPIPIEFPPFMPHNKVLQYFRMYASHFNLLEHIKFNTKVIKLEQTECHLATGRWLVTTQNTEKMEAETTEIFDGVMICAGHHRFPHKPLVEGLSRFKGQVLHSSEYKKQDLFNDRKVLIIGMGNSAVDIATDASYVAKKVDISTRRGSWVISRFFPGGLPADFLANTRFMLGMPRKILQWMVEQMVNFKYNSENYGLTALHRGLESHPTIHDYLTIRIMSGYIRIRPSLTHLTSDGAVFDDGHFEDYDTLVLATGFEYKFPFLNDRLVYNGSEHINAYKFTFLPHLERPETLAFIGLVQAIGAVMPISELQARWFARLAAGKQSLPSTAHMYNYIEQRWRDVKENYINTRRHDNLETYWVPAMDDIANEIGVRPNMASLLSEDPLFAVRCYFGPCVPAQYRLHGPHSKPGLARRSIENCFTNITKSTQHRKVTVAETKKGTVTLSQRLISLKVLIYTLTFVFIAFLLAHVKII